MVSGGARFIVAMRLRSKRANFTLNERTGRQNLGEFFYLSKNRVEARFTPPYLLDSTGEESDLIVTGALDH